MTYYILVYESRKTCEVHPASRGCPEASASRKAEAALQEGIAGILKFLGEGVGRSN